MFLLKLFGSKKLIAVVGGVIAVVLTPILNSKLHLSLTEAQVAEVIAAVGAMVLTFVAAQWHVDIKSEGQTTTAAMLTRMAQPDFPKLPLQLEAAARVALGFIDKDSPAAKALRAGLGEDAPKE